MPFITARAIRGVAAVVAISAAVPLVLSAVAYAEPAPVPDPNGLPVAPVVDPRAECENPDFGGVFVTVSAEHSECQYIVEGQFYYDNYDNGAYTGTLVYRDGARVATERPVMPGTLTMPGGRPAPVIVFPGQF